MNRPSFRSIDIWADCEKSILYTLSEALVFFREYVDASKTENDITVELCKAITDIRFKKQRDTLADYGNVINQSQNQPVNALGVAENSVSLRKKPDILWVFYDENADVPEKSQRYFTIECKCLSDRTTTRDYVENGISRFVLNECGYGRNEKSSAMIGYIKAENGLSYCKIVNEKNQKRCYPILYKISSGIDSAIIERYRQDFITREFKPTRFSIHHLWAYINYTNTR